jgi:hypothetical protein
MSVSRLTPGGGANDFNVICSNVYTSVTFTKEFSGGAYSIISSIADTTYDIYAYNTNGTLVGYTNSASLTTTGGFVKLVIIGQTANNTLEFTYKETFTATDDSDEVTAGPVIASLTPTDLSDIDDTTTITGRNFATDATVTFSSTTGSYTSTAAKSVVRASATSLLVTRPDNFPSGSSPYTVTVQNPGVQNPVGSNANIATNSITAGTAPVWSTSTPLPAYSKNVAYSTTLVATDVDGSVSYNIASGALPTGLTLTSTSGVIAGTVTTSNTSSYSVTIRATDAGGNFVDRAFAIPNRAPTWNTAAGALADYSSSASYSVQLSATDDDTLTYSILSGSLPSGLTLSSSGLISGSAYTGSVGTFSFTVRVTDTAGQVADRAFSIFTSIFAVGATVTITAPTQGRTGSTLAGYQSNCNNAAIANNITVSSGIISFASLFPSGSYTVTFAGAKGGNSGTGRVGGNGYQFASTFTFSGTDTLKVIIGQTGEGGASRSSGGGGGTYMWRNSDNLIYGVAGGGGGAAYDSTSAANGTVGQSSTSGSSGNNSGGAGGNSGSGGTGGDGGQGYGAGGAGWNSNGTGFGGIGMQGGFTPANGGSGGLGYYSNETGGFGGGGGGGNYGGGGGGGYSGGGGGRDNGGGGGGGGSYTSTSMSSQTTNSGGGFITITRNS